MSIDLPAATSFMATHARVLDHRRFELIAGDGDPAAVFAAVDGYRNADGGYGWGLEPDLRSPESQPGGALHALEAFGDAAALATTTPRAAELCDWLERATLDDGGLPFALPVTDTAGVAPFWASWDPQRSSLQITSYVAAAALELAEHDRAVAAHPWLATATRYCLKAIDAIDPDAHALVVAASLLFLDALSATDPQAAAVAADRLRPLVPRDGRLRVAGGAEDEAMHPLDLAPTPNGPARALIDDEAIEADLARLERDQQPDGGWHVDFDSYSPAATLEWRGYTTVKAIDVLKRNARL